MGILIDTCASTGTSTPWSSSNYLSKGTYTQEATFRNSAHLSPKNNLAAAKMLTWPFKM